MTRPRSAAEIAHEWTHDLLPPGDAWHGKNLHAILRALAEPCATLEDAAARVSGEICPAASDALLDDYRAVLGADPLGRDANLTTRQQWRDLLQARWVARGDQRPAFYRALAQQLGTEITIDEPIPAQMGTHVCGQPVCAGPRVMFAWIVHLPSIPATDTCGAAQCGVDVCGRRDPNPYATLMRIFTILKPADTAVYFTHEGQWLNG